MSTDHLVMPEDHMEELYSSPNPLVKYVHGSRLDAIVKVLPLQEKLVVVDAGCGEGHLIEKLHGRFPNHAYIGLDATPVALEKARTRCPYGDFRREDLTQLKLKSESVDVLICTEVLEHIPEYQQVIREFKRVLKRDGTLILTFPNETLWTVSRFLLGRKPIKVPDHVNSFSPSQMEKTVGLPLMKKKNLPFGLPFAVSLNGLLVFQKK